MEVLQLPNSSPLRTPPSSPPLRPNLPAPKRKPYTLEEIMAEFGPTNRVEFDPFRPEPPNSFISIVICMWNNASVPTSYVAGQIAILPLWPLTIFSHGR